MNRFHTTKTKRFEAMFVASFRDGRTVVEEIKGLKYMGCGIYVRDYVAPRMRRIRQKLGIANHQVIGPKGRLP